MASGKDESLAPDQELVDTVKPMGEAILEALSSPEASPAVAVIRREEALDILASGIATIVASLGLVKPE